MKVKKSKELKVKKRKPGKNYYSKIASKLDDVWRQSSPTRKACLEDPEGVKFIEKALVRHDGKISIKKMKFYKCAHCHEFFQKVEIDHIVPKGPKPTTLEELHAYIDKLESRYLQKLCIFCHGIKTDKDKSDIKKIKGASKS